MLIDLGRIVDYVHQTFTDKGRKETTQEANGKFYEYIDIYEKNRIYFDDDLCKEIEDVRNLVIEMLDGYRRSNNFLMQRNSTHPDIDKYITKAFESEEEVYKKFSEEFPRLRDKLRNEFRQLLFAENPNYQLGKKS